MNLAATFIAITLGQPPAITSDYFPMDSRKIKIPIAYEKNRNAIRQLKLYVARNGENTWYQEAVIPPGAEFFPYIAKEDGIYWFTIVEEDLQGKHTPADLTRSAPDLKVIVDTIQPRVQFTNTRRNGEEILIEWAIDDKNPDDSRTQVHFQVGGADAPWKDVILPATSRSGVRFLCGTTGPVAVRVTGYDIAANKTQIVHEFPAVEASTLTSTSMSPGPAVPAPKPLLSTGSVGAGDGGPLSPAGNPPSKPSPPPRAAETDSTPVARPAPPAIPPASPSGGSTVPLPTVDPRAPLTAGGGTGGSGKSGAVPVAVWSGAPSTPTVEVSRAQSINYLAFDLGYEIESRGPSGISRLDLWVTRDEGKTWMKWSEHAAKGGSVRVNLNVPANPQPEGTYGFRIVPVSGAGLSEREPVAGDVPDYWVVVDVTPPQVDLFPPTGDPSRPDTLLIQWKASDKNFGEDPITIEWSDKPNGPWQPATGAVETQQVSVGSAAQNRRLPNNGSFPWRVPAGVAPRVYLKLTARDAAGNVREVVTRDPILVDLVKPKARISGIITPAGGTPRP